MLYKLTPFGILYPLIIVSLVIQRPFPITTGYILQINDLHALRNPV